MATRTKTVEYAFTTNTANLALATRYDFAAVTLDIEETSSRVFKSVIIQVTSRSSAATAQSLTSYLLGIKLGAVAFNDSTTTFTITDTGDHQSFMFHRDVTSYFTTNYGGAATQTCQVGVQFGAVAMINISCKLIITYEYDDSSATTRTKTVKIPLESNTSNLTATLAQLGTNQIPILTGGSGILPENTITIKDYFFEIWSAEGHDSGVTDDQLGLQIDAEAETLFGSLEQALDTNVWMHVLWKRTDLIAGSGSTHAFNCRGTTTGRLGGIHVVLVVTYSYDHSASTSVLNSLELVITTDGGNMGGSTSADQNVTTFNFYIEEPATIALKQSGIQLFYNFGSFANPTVSIACGSQTARNYAYTYVVNAPATGYAIMHRIDSSAGAGSAGITLARGLNTLTLKYFNNNASNFAAGGAGIKARMYLNYTSGKHADGDGVHCHTIRYAVDMGPQAMATNGRRITSAFAPNIPETNYWVNGIDLDLLLLKGGSRDWATVGVEQLSGEGPADGWLDAVAWTQNIGSSEICCWEIPLNIGKYFKRHPTDPDTSRVALETSRKYKYSTTMDNNAVDAGFVSLIMCINYHGIVFDVNGSVTGYTGGGSGIDIRVHNATTHEYIQTTSTSAGGSFSTVWYDDVADIYCTAIQDSTHHGRSDDTTAA